MGSNSGTHLVWALSAILTTAACVLLVWAVRGDPARGRRRCPKCWYLMEGVTGLTCPECGSAAVNERGLLRTRRHRRGLWLAVLLLLVAGSAWLGERVQRLGWRAAPVTVRVFVLPWMDLTTGDFQAALNEGVRAGMPGWGQRLVVSRLRSAMKSDVPAMRNIAATLARDYWQHGCDTTPLRPDLVVMLDDADQGAAYSASNAIGFMWYQDQTLAPLWLRLAGGSPHALVRADAVAALSRTAASDSRAEVLLLALNDPDPQVVVQAIFAVCRLQLPGGVERLLPLLTGAANGVSNKVASQIGQYGERAADAVPIMIGMLRSEDPMDRMVYASGLGRMGAVARSAVPALLVILSDGDEQVRIRGVRALGSVAMAGDAQVTEAMLPSLRGGSVRFRIAAVKALCLLEWACTKDDRATVEGLLRSESAEGRVWAGFVLARADGRLEVFVDELIALLDSQDHWEMEAAADALGSLGAAARRAVPSLERFAGPLGPAASAEDQIRWQAATRNLELLRTR